MKPTESASYDLIRDRLRVITASHDTDVLDLYKKNKKALAAYEKFSPSHKRDYIEWITDAKAEATRDRRIAQAVEWMAEGKPRNWKYM